MIIFNRNTKEFEIQPQINPDDDRRIGKIHVSDKRIVIGFIDWLHKPISIDLDIFNSYRFIPNITLNFIGEFDVGIEFFNNSDRILWIKGDITHVFLNTSAKFKGCNMLKQVHVNTTLNYLHFDKCYVADLDSHTTNRQHIREVHLNDTQVSYLTSLHIGLLNVMMMSWVKVRIENTIIDDHHVDNLSRALHNPMISSCYSVKSNLYILKSAGEDSLTSLKDIENYLGDKMLTYLIEVSV